MIVHISSSMFIIFFLQENTSQFFEKYKLSGKTNKIVLSTQSIQSTLRGFQVVHTFLVRDFHGFSYGRVPKVPRIKFHGLRAFGAFGTKSKGDQNKNKVVFKPPQPPQLPPLPQKTKVKRDAKILVKIND